MCGSAKNRNHPFMPATAQEQPTLRPDAERHLRKARDNFALYEQLRGEGKLDWAVTLLFYSALQLVDAWLVQNGHGTPPDHDRRRKLIMRYLSCIWDRRRTHYKDLEDASRDARYNLAVFSDAQVQNLHDREFGHIKAQMANRDIRL